MNDLAESALHAAASAGRAVRVRPMRTFGAAGLVVSAVVVAAGGRVAALAPSRPLTSWLGLEWARGTDPGDQRPGVVMLLALVALVLLWLALVATVRRQRQPLGRVWAVAGAWALPFVLGPPLMDTGVLDYVADGRLARYGRDPYVVTPAALGSSPIVTAIDPSARDQQSSAGALGTLIEHFAVSVSDGRLFGALLVWRGMGVLAAFAIGRAAVRLADSPRGAALALVLPNPLVLLYVVSAPHLEGITVALALGAAVAARRGRWTSAVVLASLAGSVTATGFVAVPLVVATHVVACRARPRDRDDWWRALVRDLAAVAVTIAVTRLAVPDGFGWVRTGRGQFDQHTPFAIADVIGRVVGVVVRAASYDDRLAAGQLTAALAALAVLVYLLVTCRHRSLEAGIGYSLLALALLAPVLHPWYLMWGVVVLAPTATGMRRTWVLALSAAGCVLSPPGIPTPVSYLLTGFGLAVIAVITAATLRSQDRQGPEDRRARADEPDAQRPPDISRTAGRTSAR